VFLLRVNLHSAHFVRDPDADRDCSKHLLDGGAKRSDSGSRPGTTTTDSAQPTWPHRVAEGDTGCLERPPYLLLEYFLSFGGWGPVRTEECCYPRVLIPAV